MDKKDIGVHDFLGYKGRFPQQRVQKLMNLDRNCGLTSRVLVEGAFIELTSKGLPVRQVYIGLTSDEMIFVIEEISPKVCTKNKSDLELDGLVIDAIYPLSNVTIVPSNERQMAFSVIIPGETVLHFEMCKLDASFRNKWNTWRKLLDEICDQKYMNNSKNSIPMNADDVQTNMMLLETPSFSTSSESDMGVWSVSSEDLVQGTFQLGRNPTERLKWLYGGHRIMYSAVYGREDDVCCVSKSSSWNDMTSGAKTASPSVDVMSFQKILRKRERSSSHILQTITPIPFDDDSDSDSQDEIDAIFDEAMNIHKRSRDVRSAKELWCLAKELTISNRGGSFNRMLLEKAVDHVVFQVMSTRKKPIAESILDCQPLEVALELTIMSRGLLMAIRPSDLQQIGNNWSKKIPASINNIRRHGDVLSKFVMSEILRGQSVGDRVTIIKFFIDVCYHLLFAEKDFNTLIYILRGMTSLPVYRLENTWATFFVQDPLKFSEFQAVASLLSPLDNYKSYRTRANLCRMRQSPYVPWFDHFLLYCRRYGMKDHSEAENLKYSTEHKETNQASEKFTPVNSKNEVIGKRFVAEEKYGTSSRDAGMISILKKKRRNRMHRKLNKLLNIFKRKETKTVTFFLSELELSREAEHERSDSNIKHLAKTRKYPLDYEIDVEVLSGTLGRFDDEARNQYGRHIRGDVKSSVVERYSEGLSAEIIGDALNSICPPNNSIHDTENNAYVEDHRKKNQEIPETATSKIKPKKKGKRKRDRKTPIAWIQNKISHRKDRKKNKADIEHVNTIQTDIDEINNLLEGLPGQNSDESVSDVDQMDTKSNKTIRTDDAKVKFKENNRDTSSKMDSETVKDQKTRRQSYVPASVLRDRRKSLFEEAYDEEKDEQADDEFANSIDKKMMDLKDRRKSVALELLDSNDNSTPSDKRFSKQIYNNNDIQTQMYMSAIDEIDQCSSSYPDERREPNVSLNGPTKSLSAENVFISRSGLRGFAHFGGDHCVYSESVYDQLYLFQKLALETHQHSSKRVRECIEKLMGEVDCVSNFDLFSLSLIRE